MTAVNFIAACIFAFALVRAVTHMRRGDELGEIRWYLIAIGALVASSSEIIVS